MPREIQDIQLGIPEVIRGLRHGLHLRRPQKPEEIAEAHWSEGRLQLVGHRTQAGVAAVRAEARQITSQWPNQSQSGLARQGEAAGEGPRCRNQGLGFGP